MLAFVILPIILGPIGIVMGVIAKSKGEKRAQLAISLSIAGLIVGMALGFLVVTSFM